MANFKNIIITDALDKELKHLTLNQLKLLLSILLASDTYDAKKSIFHNQVDRYQQSREGIKYLQPQLTQISNIKNITLDKTTKKIYNEELRRLKNELRTITYYKIPVNDVKELLSSDYTKTELLFILKFYSILRMTFHKKYTYKTKDFIESVFGPISKMDMSKKRRILYGLFIYNEVTPIYNKVTPIYNEVTIIYNEVTKKPQVIIP